MAGYYSDFFAAVLVWQILRGELHFLVVPTLYNRNIQVKFPGGKNEQGEQPGETVVRELKEETGFSVSGKDPELILIQDADGHQKHFFLVHVSHVAGEMRRGNITPRVEKVLFPPQWRPAAGLAAAALMGQIFPTHRMALEEAVKRINHLRQHER